MESATKIRVEGAEPESVFARLPWLLTLEALLLVVLAYPLQLKSEWRLSFLRSVRSFMESLRLPRAFLDDTETIVSFYLSPLVMKSIIAAACAFGVIAVLIARKFLDKENGQREIAKNSKALRAYYPYLFTLIFVVWTAISALWSPTRATSLSYLPWLIGLGGFAYLQLRRGMKFEEVEQISVLLILMGAIAATISILEATELFRGAIFKLFLRFDDPRNLYGSVLGHNTAAGSFLLLTTFPALALALAGGLWRRILTCTYLALALFAILVTQSRAIWIFGALLIPLFLYLAARQAKLPRAGAVATIVLSSLAFALASQAVRAPWNPLYVEGNPIGRRLQDLSPERLKEEARIRLFICSLPLVVERPFFGWGLSSFQYVYPKAQADFLARHPDSNLGLTIRRSHMAHNEYLQVAVEQGLIGLLLFALAIGEVVRRGLRAARALTGNARLLHLAVGFSALAVGLHAFVDFPYHVPQLLVPWIICLAAFASFRGEGQPEIENSVASEHATARESANSKTSLFAGNVVRIVGVWIVIFMLPLAAYPLVRAMQADTQFVRGSGLVELVSTNRLRLAPVARIQLMREAIDRLTAVLRLQPYHDEARYILSEAHYLQALSLAETDAALPNELRTPNVPAIESAKHAVEVMNDSLNYLRYHDAYYMLALYDFRLWKLGASEPGNNYEAEYARNLRTALYYAPSHVFAMRDLAEWMANQQNPDMARVVKMRRKIRELNPYAFYENYERSMIQLMDRHDFVTASQAAEALLQVDNNEPDYLRPAIWVNVMAGTRVHHQHGLELIAHFRDIKLDPKRYPVHPIYNTYSTLLEAVLKGDWKTAQSELSHHPGDDPRMRAMLAAIETKVREGLGASAESTRVYFSKPAALSDEEWSRLCLEQAAMVQFRIFLDSKKALELFQQRQNMSGPAPHPFFWIDYADLAASIGDQSLMKHCIDELRVVDPSNPMIDTLTGRLAKAANRTDRRQAAPPNDR